jgi:SAM-dependent methyltransferase
MPTAAGPGELGRIGALREPRFAGVREKRAACETRRMRGRSSTGRIARRLIDLNRRPFGRAEAAYYEVVAAPAVRAIVAPVLLEQLRAAPTGQVLDVGCGGGVLTSQLGDGGRTVVGVDPSIPQLERLRRRARLSCAAASAAALPFAPASFAAVVSSCAVKHWPNRRDGLAECARVLGPGGVLVVVEIDGGRDDTELLRFASRTRIPPGMRWLYPGLARRTFVPLSPTAEEIVADCAAAGLSRTRHWRIEGMPFLVVTAIR